MKDKFYKWDKFIGSYQKAENTDEALKLYKAEREKERCKTSLIVVEKGSYFQFVANSDETLVHKKTRKGKKKLTDGEVLWAREQIVDSTYTHLAQVLNVSRHTLEKAIKGETYRHLNHIIKPQR
jgi:uncharacterized protein (DUF2344 family)